jgi:hypothetical protein
MTPVPFSSRSFGAVPAGVVLVLTASLALAACGGGSKHNNTQPATVTTPKVLAVKTSVLHVGTVDIETAGPSNPIDPAAGKAVLGAAQSYIDDAIFAPLKTGKLGSGYASSFDTALKATATGADINALTEVGAGKLTKLSTTATPVLLSTLEGKLGEVMYFGTDFDLNIKGNTDAGPVKIHRHIELTFARTGKSWLITAYRVNAQRKSTAGTTTTTATGGTTP